MWWRLVDWLDSKGYCFGVRQESMNEGYDAGFEDGYNYAIELLQKDKEDADMV